MPIHSYTKGSQWRRWDLHIHTPGTKKKTSSPVAPLKINGRIILVILIPTQAKFLLSVLQIILV